MRPRIAFLSPINPATSGVADYSELIVLSLTNYCDVDVYSDDGLIPANKAIVERCLVRGYSEFEENRAKQQYAATVIQLGNSAQHIECYDHLQKYGGIAVLHDLNLSGIIGAKTLARGDLPGFFKEMLRAEGVTATIRVLARFAVTRQLPGRNDWWMNHLALRRGSAIVVHNEHAATTVRRELRSLGTDTPVWKVDLPVMPLVSDHDKYRDKTYGARARANLGLDRFDFVIGSFGVLDESKRLSVALTAFSHFLQKVPNALYVLVGHDAEGFREKVQVMGLTDHVRLTGRVDGPTFCDYMSACDFCINLRYPVHGESSAPLLQEMSMGKVVAVTDYAQFREFPNDVCCKIGLGPHEVDVLTTTLCEMAASSERRLAMGVRARQYVDQFHSLDQAARKYTQVITSVMEAPPRVSALGR